MKKFLCNNIIFLVLIALTGCATNPYSAFYRDLTGGMGVANTPFLIMPTGEPRIIQGTDFTADTKKMYEEGYVPIGESAFNAANASQPRLIRQAKKVNAEVVLVYQRYTGTVSGSFPLDVPDTKSSTIYASGFSGNTFGFGSANQTTYGTRTTYIPYNIQRYDFFAGYWVKSKPRPLGVQFRDLTDEEKRSIGSNKGTAVSAVVRNSPAYNADILPGDIFTKIQNEPIVDPHEFMNLLQKYQGQEIEIEIMRGTQALKKSLKLNKESPN